MDEHELEWHRDQMAQLKAHREAGETVRKARELRDLHGHSPEQSRELRSRRPSQQPCVPSASGPRAPSASVTIERQVVEPGGYGRFGWHRPRHRRFPICIDCWLDRIAATYWRYSDRYLDRGVDYQRLRCASCGRPMRVRLKRWHPYLAEQVCCSDCARKLANARARTRRRVQHEQEVCEACGKSFVPKRSDAKTCSNACRQRLHRERHRLSEGQSGWQLPTGG
jgi:hypothetical protein